MKILLFVSLILALCQGILFCDDYLEFDNNYYGNIIAGVKLTNTTDVILTEKRVVILDDQLNILSSNLLPQTTDQPCEWIFMNNPSQFFVGCQKGSESPYLISFKKINDTHFSQFGGIVYFPNLNSKLKQITGRLNTVFAIETTKITLFTLVISVSDWTIKTSTQSVLNNDYFSYQGQLNITDVAFAPFTDDNLQQYKIMLTDYIHGIFWLDAYVKNNLVAPYRSGNVEVFPGYQSRKQSTIIHQTTQNLSIITVNFYFNQNSINYRMTMSSVLTTKIEERFQNRGIGFYPWGQSIASRNITAIQFRSSLNQTAILIYNAPVAILNIVENSNEDQNSVGYYYYDPVDKLTSSPQQYSVFYFNTGNRIVHTIDENKLQSCELYNYKLSIE